jgi:hypothetical protein
MLSLLGSVILLVALKVAPEAKKQEERAGPAYDLFVIAWSVVF